MIKKKDQYKKTVMKDMFGGQGEVVLEHFWEKDELKANNRLCAKLQVEPGCSIGFHVHEDEEEIFIILKGKAQVDDNGTQSILKEGDTLLTKSGEGHDLKCIGDETLELLAFISLYNQDADQ